MNHKALTSISLLLLIGCLATSCHNEQKAGTPKSHADSTKTAATISSANPVAKLLLHFKDNNSFPIVIDTAYMNKVAKNDSLGTSMLKILAKEWFIDSLTMDSSKVLNEFYTIDSVKAKHHFEKWASKLDIGETKFSNAYGLFKTTLTDGTTLLIWTLIYSSYEADPNYYSTTIYFTLLKDSTIGQTFLLGENYFYIDPPSAYQRIISGNLSADGKLTMEENALSSDLDTLLGDSSHVHYEYRIDKAGIALKNKQLSPSKQVKLKAEN